MKKLNIIYIHAHDLGRFCEPMGYDIPAPNLMRFAKEGVLFRQCYASAPTCAPSRAALLTGQYPHCCGMLGLPSEPLGYSMNDYSRHISAFLKQQGYSTALVGAQHVAREPWAPPEDVLAYDHFLNAETRDGSLDKPGLAASAAEFLEQEHEEPFFLSVGFFDPHRNNDGDRRTFIESRPIDEPADIDERARYCQPWPHMPDNAITRREMANFRMGVAWLDKDVGTVLEAIDRAGLRENSLVIFTTDHGPGVCEMKTTLTDRGTGVVTIIRGPSDPSYGDTSLFTGGRVIDAMTQHIDLYPTFCEAINAEKPDWLDGKSLMPLIRDEVEELHNCIFSEQTYHYSAEPRPLRAVRTKRYKYIRSYRADAPRGIDEGPPQAWWKTFGYKNMLFPDESLFDLVFDPNEANNLANSPDHAEVLKEMRKHLRDWMKSTDDPLIDGAIPIPPVGRHD